MGNKGRRNQKNNTKNQQINSNFKLASTSSSDGINDPDPSDEGSNASYSGVGAKSVPVEKSKLQSLGDSFKYIGAAIAILIPIVGFVFWISSINFKVVKNSEDLSEIQSEEKEINKKVDGLLAFKISSSKDIEFIKEKQKYSNDVLRKLNQDVRNDDIKKSNKSIRSNTNTSAD